MQSHDPAYKQFFSDPAMVSSLLRDFVDEDFYGGAAAQEHCRHASHAGDRRFKEVDAMLEENAARWETEYS